ncbi:MAG: DUF4474 domain-containing protein [Acutalibacteraceae bacterium]
MKNTGSISLKKALALILAMTFVLSVVLSGCTLGKDKDSSTTTDPSSSTASPIAYIDPDSEVPGVNCPACGSPNVGDAKTQNDEHDEHYICYDCNCEWYVEDGTAYQIADSGEAVKMVTTKAPVYTTRRTTTRVTNKPVATKSSTTTTTTKKGSTITTDDAKELAKFLATGEWLKYINWYIDEEGNITTDGDKGVLGFGYSTSEKCFYATGNAWQRNFGYSDLYDKTSQLIAISYDTSKIFFVYEGKEWMIQLWKGQYGFVLLGAEVGVYNRPQGSSSSTYFDCASDDELLPIGLTLYKDGSQLFSRKQKDSWWMTGFVPGQMGVGAMVGSKYTKTLSTTIKITFKDEAMRKAFVIGLKKCSYIYNNVDGMDAQDVNKGKRTISFVEGSGTVPGTYSVSGNTVMLSWQ